MRSQKNSHNSQSAVLSCRHIAKKFDQVDLFKDITFVIHKNEKVGLVGPNGSGKSTLLKIIAGSLEKDDGTVTLSKNLKTEYLPQTHLNQLTLSGGEAAKKVLAPIIASDARLFLLDEPTNNLDVEGLEMMEDFISKNTNAFLIVSHDRMFLDKTVSKIIEIDPLSKTCVIYPGNYSFYLKERAEQINRQWKEYADKTEKIEKFNDSLDQRLSWMKKIEYARKNIKNLSMHEKEKPVAATLRDQEAKAGRRARIMKDRLEKYKEDAESIKKPTQLRPLKIMFNTDRGSIKVFTLKGVTKKIGDRKIGPIDLTIQYGDRVQIVGKNGAGKTTLLKMLMGEIKPDGGTIEWGENVRIGYVPQQRWFPVDITVIKEFISVTELSETDARKVLNRFRLTNEDVKKNVQILSPGEYSRLILAELLVRNPNCIIVDEPSNHLDLEVLEELENGLQQYTGTLIVVSHDRYFVEKLRLKTFQV